MEELAGILLEAHERAPAPAAPRRGELIAGKRKTERPSIGKMGYPPRGHPETSNKKTRRPLIGKVSFPPEGDRETIKRKEVKPLIAKAVAPAEEPTSALRRPYGERGDFEKITVTLPAEVRVMLLEESLRRKKERSPDWPITAIVREALAAYLAPKP
jgi:hypothetical protein